MTAEHIMQIVHHEASDALMGYDEINHLIRYFLKKSCIWMTNESIGRISNTSKSNVSKSIEKVERDQRYTFVKNRIHRVINEELKGITK